MIVADTTTRQGQDIVRMYESGKRTQAFDLAGEMLAHYPGHAPAALVRIDYLFSMGLFERCIDEARKMVSMHPAEPDAWIRMALSYACSAQYDRAVSCLNEALAWLPEKTVLRNHLGIIYRMAGEPEKALGVFRECARRNPAGAWNEHNMLWGLLCEPISHAAETFAELREEND